MAIIRGSNSSPKKRASYETKANTTTQQNIDIINGKSLSNKLSAKSERIIRPYGVKDKFKKRDTVLEIWKSNIIRDMIDPKLKNYIKIITGATAQGKTHFKINEGLPKLINEGVKLIILSDPLTELTHAEDIEVLLNSQDIHNAHVYLNPPSDGKLRRDIIKYSRFGIDKVYIVPATHNKVCDNEDNYIKSREYITKEFGLNKTALWGEEIHFAGPSSKEAVKSQGSTWNEKYTFRLHQCALSFLKETSYVFFNTATPTPEMFFPDKYENQYKIIGGDWINPKELIGYYKWQEEQIEFDKCDRPTVKKQIKSMLDYLIEKNNSSRDIINRIYGLGIPVKNGKTKLTGMILGEINKIIVELVRENNWIGQSLTWGETHTTNNGKTTFKIHQLVDGEIHTEDYSNRDDIDYITEMSNEENSLKLMLVKQKGNMGVNIHNLVVGLNLTPSINKTDENGDPVVYSAIQKIGRFTRPYFGGFTRLTLEGELECDCEWDDITNIILKDHPELINEYMEIFNTYSFRTVSSPVWKQALYEFSQNYGVSLRDVEVEMGYNVSR